MAAHAAPSALAVFTKRERLPFDLRTCGRHPREARKYSFEVKVLFPRCHAWWQRGWAADDLAT